jgi:hypothetical protein
VKIPSCLFLASLATGVLALTSLSGCGSANRPATWAYISPVIFQPDCASGSCHSPGVAAAGLDFSDPDVGYSSLTRLWVWIVDRTKEGDANCGQAAGTTVCERPFRPLVTPFDPQQSRLVNMLRGRGALRMPPDRPLDEADIELVERWILNGAKKNDSDETVDAAPAADGMVDAREDAGADGSNDGGNDGGNDGADATSDAADAGLGVTDGPTEGAGG